MNSLKIAFCFLFLFILVHVAWTQEYKIESAIPYRAASAADTYTRQQCLIDIYYPLNKKDFSTVIWYHGGGLTGGKREVPKELMNQGICVVGVGYRLCSQDQKASSSQAGISTNDIVDDAAAAAAWVMKNIAHYGGNPDKVYLAGHSAGGYLVSMIGLEKKHLKKYGIDADQFAAIIPFSGQMITHFQNRRNRGMSDYQPLVDQYAPLYHIRKDCPPVILITGDRELEMLGRYEENAYMWRMLQIIGHPAVYLYELDGFNHGNMAKPAFYILLEYIRSVQSKIRAK